MTHLIFFLVEWINEERTCWRVGRGDQGELDLNRLWVRLQASTLGFPSSIWNSVPCSAGIGLGAVSRDMVRDEGRDRVVARVGIE